MTTCKCGEPIANQITAETADGRKVIRSCRAHLDKAAGLALRKWWAGEYHSYAIENV